MCEGMNSMRACKDMQEYAGVYEAVRWCMKAGKGVILNCGVGEDS